MTLIVIYTIYNCFIFVVLRLPLDKSFFVRKSASMSIISTISGELFVSSLRWGSWMAFFVSRFSFCDYPSALSSATDSSCSWNNSFAIDVTMKPLSPASATDIISLANRDIVTLSKFLDCQVIVADIPFPANNAMLPPCAKLLARNR